MAECVYIDVEDNDNDKNHTSNRKITNLQWFILVTNFILEVPSAVFDQLSLVHKPQYALISMFMSFIVLIISIVDLVYEGRKARVRLMLKGLIPFPWFYYPNHKPFGTFPDIIGLVCGIFQCIFSSVAYGFLSRHVDNPIKINAWPMIFSFGVLYCKFSANSRTPTAIPFFQRTKQEFTLAELLAATNNFSLENKIGVGRSFGGVYKGQLADGREVAVERMEIDQNANKLVNEEKEVLEFLAGLRHRHLVRLFGYCVDGNERLLVHEYVKNGSLYDHLHYGSEINSWKIRINIAFDSARGIEHLHKYIIHKDIKSSNILLDADWIARVSNFELSFMKFDYRIMNVGSTAGYVDPEYYVSRILTSKSDVYSFGVVLLELLTGRKPIFKDADNGKPMSVVDFAVPKITNGEFLKVLDPSVRPPELNEEEALDLVAYTARVCVKLESKYRPTMRHIVTNLKQALSLCDGGLFRFA